MPDNLDTLKVLWICFVWPEPDSSAAGYRTLQLIETLRQSGADVSVSSACQSNQYREALSKQGINTHEFAANDSEFDRFIQELQPDIVFFDRFMIEEQFSWRVRTVCPAALRILDTVDLHFLRRNRQKNIKKEDFCVDSGKENYLISDDCLRELASIYRSDLSLLVSDFESCLLQQYYDVPAELCTFLPWHYPAAVKTPEFGNRKNMVWIGNFNHAPNLDSFQILNDYLWDNICRIFRDQGELIPELHVYGAYTPANLQKAGQLKKGIKISGRAADVFTTMQQYRVNLAALRFGAGIKGKVTDGWFAGTPCVATPVAAEGLSESSDFGGFVESDADNFAESVYRLYSDKSIWLDSQLKGQKILQQKFCRQTIEQNFISQLKALLERGRGAQNTIREIFWHQQFRSTEFMSRWIELKGSLRSRLN